MRPRRLAALFAAALLRPRRAVALIVLLFRTRSEQVVLSTSLTGQALSAYFNQRSFGVFPQNRLCRGLLVLPEHHSDYLRGRRRQALRTNLRRAEVAGIRCEAISDPRRAFDEITEIVEQRRTPATQAELQILASWEAMLEGPEMTLLVARDRARAPARTHRSSDRRFRLPHPLGRGEQPRGQVGASRPPRSASDRARRQISPRGRRRAIRSAWFRRQSSPLPAPARL